MRILRETQSLCDICFRKVPAITLIKKGEVYLEKNCPRHGKAIARHFWNDPEIYQNFIGLKTIKNPLHLVVPITYRCNLNCPVCYVKANEINIKDLTLKELLKIKNYHLAYLTGGEPTTRKDLPLIIRALTKRKKIVGIFSNGIKLADYDYAKLLKKSGLKKIILQFDTTDDKHNLAIHGREMLKEKMQTIKNLESLGMETTFCAVILKNNIKELKKIFQVAFVSPAINSISINPLREMGRFNSQEFVSSRKIVAEVDKIFSISKRNWIESTKFINNWGKLSQRLRGKMKPFSKCYLICIAFKQEKGFIPITKIFEMAKINQAIEKMLTKNSNLKLIPIFIYLLFSQIIFNFFINKNFRLLLKKLLLNLKYIVGGKHSFFKPFVFVHIAIYPNLRNIDYDFTQDCRFFTLNHKGTGLEPTCLHRIKTLKYSENPKESRLCY